MDRFKWRYTAIFTVTWFWRDGCQCSGLHLCSKCGRLCREGCGGLCRGVCGRLCIEGRGGLCSYSVICNKREITNTKWYLISVEFAQLSYKQWMHFCFKISITSSEWRSWLWASNNSILTTWITQNRHFVHCIGKGYMEANRIIKMHTQWLVNPISFASTVDSSHLHNSITRWWASALVNICKVNDFLQW